MNFKRGVNTRTGSKRIWYAMGVIQAVYWMYGQSCVFTSLKDGNHGNASKHYEGEGEAVDVRTRDIPLNIGNMIFKTIKGLLDPLGFDTVDERLKDGKENPNGPHFHIEYDPKAGEALIKEVD